MVLMYAKPLHNTIECWPVCKVIKRPYFVMDGGPVCFCLPPDVQQTQLEAK